MFARFDRYRTVIHAALAALVVVALSHCSWQEARELSQWSRTVSQHRLGMPSPVQMPVHDCDHEYGCICRGATVILALDTTPFQAQLTDLVPIDFDNLSLAYVLDDLPADHLLDDPQNASPPLSGRQLRALYASLVI